jgi:hypothetical protein
MRKMLRKLRLREGDILVVRNPQDMQSLIEAGKGMKGIPNCPIIICRESVHRLSKEYIVKLVTRA